MKTHRDHIPQLDGLRGIACLMVLAWHTAGFTGWHVPIWFPGHAGEKGVEIFFVLSGFLITRILLHARAQGGSLRQFWVRRAGRIFPAWFLLLAVLAVVAPNWRLIPAALYLQNFVPLFDPAPYAYTWAGHGWSLAIEEQFYLAWPLVVFACPRRWLRVLTISGMLIGLGAGAIFAVLGEIWQLDGNQRIWVLYHNPLCRMAALLAGALFAVTESQWRGLRGQRRQMLVLAAGCALLAWNIFPLAQRHLGVEWFPIFRQAVTQWQYWLIGVGALALALAGWKPADALLREPWLLWVGQRSYGLYLYHWPLYTLIAPDRAQAQPWQVYAAVAATFIAATLSYRWFEQPVRNWINRRATTPAGHACASASPACLAQ